MTTINVLVQREAVHLYTDGSVMDDTVAIDFVQSKTWLLPHLNAAIAACGPVLFPPIFVSAVSWAARSFDELRVNALDVFRQTYEQNRQYWGPTPATANVNLVIAGISERDGPNAFAIVSHETQFGLKPWMPTSVGPLMMHPADEVILARVRELYPHGDTERLDPRVDGLRLMELQRECGAPVPGGTDRICYTGGHALLTTIPASRVIQSSILKRWPAPVLEARSAA
jgi:hypothetical protein